MDNNIDNSTVTLDIYDITAKAKGGFVYTRCPETGDKYRFTIEEDGWHWYRAYDYENGSDADDELDEVEAAVRCSAAFHSRGLEHILPMTLEEAVGISLPEVCSLPNIENLTMIVENEERGVSELIPTSPDVSDVASLDIEGVAEDEIQEAEGMLDINSTFPGFDDLPSQNSMEFSDGQGQQAAGMCEENVTSPDISDIESQNSSEGQVAGACALDVVSSEVGLTEDEDWVPSGRHYVQPAHAYTETVLGIRLKLKIKGEDGATVEHRWIYQGESDGPPPYWCGGPSNPEDELLCVTLKLRVTEYGVTRTEFRVVYGVDD
ncbi:uncharacterized protein LOC127290440 isoform X2 [Leptopilina boulardi]|uniref:uncharacterized protein LOC127287829 isoform X2 n=1 Tax=Leptopilina boulardi TaxID=63433 RepID=UPI0021F51C4B|nr:uncharacterized protein LOC127287829 isoform X2 [Leptopilina boulardi]XP_051174952.1 uncharacterized protein LOC127290440 isoform X2 [Leptopilina boulardi]